MTDAMTIKELAEVAGVSVKTIRRAVKAIGYDVKNGVAARFSSDQCIRIVGQISKVADRGHLAKAPETLVQAGNVDYSAIIQQNTLLIKTMAEMMPAIIKLADSCQRIANQQQAALPVATHMTIAGYCAERRVMCDRDAATRWGRLARAISDERGCEVRHVPDSRWGSVNAYDVRVLAEVIGQ